MSLPLTSPASSRHTCATRLNQPYYRPGPSSSLNHCFKLRISQPIHSNLSITTYKSSSLQSTPPFRCQSMWKATQINSRRHDDNNRWSLHGMSALSPAALVESGMRLWRNWRDLGRGCTRAVEMKMGLIGA